MAFPLQTAEPYLPRRPFSHPDLREAAQGCRGCELYRNATQAVFGEGHPTAEIMMVGEIPGNSEDKEGRPFVGPAGALLDRALDEVGLDRSQTYVTNAVKHFRFLKIGGYRYHRNPTALQVRACRPWLEAEIDLIHPKLIICMGSVAAGAVLRRPVTVSRERGTFQHAPFGGEALVTVHPSSILRMRQVGTDERILEEAFHEFVADLRKARRYLRKNAAA